MKLVRLIALLALCAESLSLYGAQQGGGAGAPSGQFEIGDNPYGGSASFWDSYSYHSRAEDIGGSSESVNMVPSASGSAPVLVPALPGDVEMKEEEYFMEDEEKE